MGWYRMRGVRGETENHWMTMLLRVGMGLFFLVVGVLKVGQVADTANFIMRSDVLPEWCWTPTCPPTAPWWS